MKWNWIIFVIVMIISAITIAIAAKDSSNITRGVLITKFIWFFGLWFLLLIGLTTVNSDWDISDGGEDSSWSSSSEDDDECKKKKKCY